MESKQEIDEIINNLKNILNDTNGLKLAKSDYLKQELTKLLK